MGKRTAFATTAAVLTFLAAGPALAYGNCAERDIVTRTLEKKFGESPVGAGLDGDTELYEVWQSDDGASWTILMTTAEGLTCVLAAGTEWRSALPVPPGVKG